MKNSLRFVLTICLVWMSHTSTTFADDFPEIRNSQPGNEQPMSPEEAAAAMTVPEGFVVTLFAGEPDVAQPISMETDDRGRLWVAECYTYAKIGYDNSLRDRIVILEDTDGDGRHDKRTVFWDRGDRLTSVLPGTKGCWILNSGTLSWLDDADGDDKADGEPVVYLDGFDKNQVGHNIVNGLMYGPLGWIYARHGIQATSFVGAPGTPPDQRLRFNCAIWKFHPKDHRLEIVTEGTTNPWGLDFNPNGDFFFTNNVIGHAWHAIPGAHFKRMYGADFNPHFYELIDQHADHYHWDQTASWSESREAIGIHGELGGGHSHCGGMIYQGDNWPKQYRGKFYMCNTHGRRVNCDRLVREGSGYVIKHDKDFLFANNPWFRGVDMKYGPNGEVYLSDWTDLGECHDRDGVHRTSGRIYMITYGPPKKKFHGNIQEESNAKLIEMQTYENKWYLRHARRVMFDRGLTKQEWSEALNEAEKLVDCYSEQNVIPISGLEAMVLNFDEQKIKDIVETLKDLKDKADDQLRAAILHYLDQVTDLDRESWLEIVDLAAEEESAYHRLAIISLMRKMPLDLRIQLVSNLSKYKEDQDDHNIPLMTWYGLEAAVVEYPEQALKLAENPNLGKLRTFIVRRLMHEYANNPQIGDLLTKALYQASGAGSEEANTQNINQAKILLSGMIAATRGVRKLDAPSKWSEVVDAYAKTQDSQVLDDIRELSLVFGDGRAMQELFKIAKDKDASPIDRNSAIQQLAERNAEGLLKFLKSHVTDRVVSATSIKALAAFDDPEVPRLLIKRYRSMKKPAKAATLETLCSRPSYAGPLLNALKNESLSDAELTASQARQIAQFDDPELNKLLENVWGVLVETSEEKLQRIEQLKQSLNEETLEKANLAAGRTLFDKTCANCHRLFNSGKDLAPDLTGGNRTSLHYLVENILSPSTVVPNQYKVSTFVLDSGRIINGVVKSKTSQTVVVQTEKEEIAIPEEEIEVIKPSNLSLMPEGLIDRMSSEQIRDLIAYLQSSNQVLPE